MSSSPPAVASLSRDVQSYETDCICLWSVIFAVGAQARLCLRLGARLHETRKLSVLRAHARDHHGG